jgi:hypothetical protein
MSGMQLKNEHVQRENFKLLMEILNLKNRLSEINAKRGPANPEYISLSIKLDILTKKYIDEKLAGLLNNSIKDEIEGLTQKELDISSKKDGHKRKRVYGSYHQSFILYYRNKNE